MREFVNLPKSLYSGDPLWVPPIWGQEKKAYTPAKNPILAKSEYTLLVLRDAGRCIGRTAVYIDPAYNEYFKTKTGLFGSFECAPEPGAAEELLSSMERWISSKGMERILGPLHPVAECWGFELEQDGRPPIFLTPHTPPEYLDYFVSAGYSKAKDLLVYDGNADGGYTIPRRIERFVELLLERKPSLSTRCMSSKSVMTDAEHIWRLSNEAISGNWGYVPVEREIMLDMVKRLKPVLDPDAIWFVEDDGVPVAFCLGFPDVNQVLRRTGGRLLPFGFVALLRAKKTVRDYRLFGLAVHPDYQGLGLDVLLYQRLFNALKPRNIRLEANYILEDNDRIRNALVKLDMRLIKSYRIFEKKL